MNTNESMNLNEQFVDEFVNRTDDVYVSLDGKTMQEVLDAVLTENGDVKLTVLDMDSDEESECICDMRQKMVKPTEEMIDAYVEAMIKAVLGPDFEFDEDDDESTVGASNDESNDR